MRIGIDARLWSQTGVGRYIQNLIIELQEIDSKNHYILFVRSEDFDHVKNKIHNSQFKLKICNISWHSIAEQLTFPKIVLKENLSLMHFPYFSVPILYRKPFVMTMHDLTINQTATGKASTKSLPVYRAKRLAYNIVVVSALKRAEKVMVPTQVVKDELLNTIGIPQEKVVVIHEGASFLKKNKKNTNHGEYFLYVGNAYPHKNLDCLISAYNEFIKLHPEIKLVLIGEKDYFYQRLEGEVKKLGLEKSIIIKGRVSDDELIEYYEGAQALIMPSLKEGFGLTTLEAMGLGCIVLSSNIPVLREVCGDAAIYFNPVSSSSLLEAMQKVFTMSFDKQHSYRKKGLSRVQLFSWKKMAQETLRVYESCSRL